MALTQKQEKFCQCVVDGMSYKDSYIAAYDYNGKSEQVPYNEGSKLALDERIQERIKELQKPIIKALETRQLNARQKQIEFIESRIEHCLNTGDEQSIIRYTDMLNKINALYKENDTVEKNNNDLETIDTSRLFKLVANE